MTNFLHRVRAAGILIDRDRILLALELVTASGTELWIPPGGGLEDSDASVVECLRREFAEETGLVIEVGNLRFVREFREGTTHHLELFFDVYRVSGEIVTIDRDDAPFGSHPQRHVRWFTKAEAQELCVRPAEVLECFDQPEPPSDGARYLGLADPLP